MMRTLTGVVAGLIAGMALPASAAPPTPQPYHPHGTIGPLIYPAGCHVVDRVNAEQHRRGEVRELDVVRFRCGSHRRAMVVHGRWMPGSR